MEKLKTIGEQIKSAREQQKLTQVQLFEKSRISVFTIQALEQAKQIDCGTYVIRQLQKALNIKIIIE